MKKYIEKIKSMNNLNREEKKKIQKIYATYEMKKLKIKYENSSYSN
jgi:hypothetical protein